MIVFVYYLFLLETSLGNHQKGAAMPYIRGVRDYSFYNDEDIDHNMSFEELQAIRLSRVPVYRPVATLSPIVEALRNLATKDGVHDADVRESAERSAAEPQQFVAEDGLALADMSVVVDGVGVLQFPLEEDVVDKLIGVESSCPPGEVVGNNSKIPASQIKVELTEEALSGVVKVISDCLNIQEKCLLKVDVRCLSVYGPGRFCGSQTGAEREDDSPLRLEVVLPCHCEGGDLYIKHGTQSRKCCSRGEAGTARWIAYYSDCARRLFEVEQGHRVVLTFDVQLEYLAESEPSLAADVDVSLNNAVSQHFSREDGAGRLLVFLLHRYTEETLDWHRMKGRDSTYARALLSVAKSQNLRPFLALARCLETWETSGYHGPVRNGGSVELHCWVDESGRRETENVCLDYEAMAREVCTFREEFWSLGEPDREVTLGWYGEGPAIREQLYHRACVVLKK